MKSRMFSILISIQIIFCFIGLYGCNESTQGMNLLLNKPMGTLAIRDSMKENEFFFTDISQERKYKVQHSFFSTFPSELSLQITMESQYENGKLYMIKCDFLEDFPERYEDGTDRLSLGYFYVQNDSNTIYRIREENMTDETMVSEEAIKLAGSIVCQEEEMVDVLKEGEKGWHERITIGDDLRIYRSYNDLTNTGFYEQFIWKRGYGLFYYTSGYGAERDMIELSAQ